MILQSIRWRLQLWYGLVFLTVLAGFGVTAYELERSRQLRDLDAEFQRRIGPLSSAFRPPPRQGPPGGPGMGRGGPGGRRGQDGPPDGDFQGGGPPEDRPFPGPGDAGFRFRIPPDMAALFGGESNSFYYVVWGRDGKELSRSDAAPQDLPPPPARPGARPLAEPEGPPPAEFREPPPPPQVRMRGTIREFFHTLHGGEIVLVGRSIAEELAGMRVVAWSLAGAGTVVLLLGLTGGWWVASRAMRPVEEISATAVKIAAGDLSQRISAADTDSELGRLATVLNSTFARLEAAFAQQQQFTADAAHELRTPITVMLTQTQTTLNRERGAAEYRATVEACQRAAQRMRGLMESLLQLARLDAGQEAMKRMPFDLSKLVSDRVEMVGPLAAERGIKIHCAVPPLPCAGDPERIGQVITNILGNAIEYNKEAGEVRITGADEGGTVVLTVADTGRGIAAGDLPRIFERFYRADKSRSGGGHTGLGMAISKAIIEAHGGGIEVKSTPGAGATFTVRLPVLTADSGNTDRKRNISASSA
jgi:heavy metal sensor kinase